MIMSSRTRSQKVNKWRERQHRTRFQVVIKRGKSNILLFNANLRSSKALKGSGVCLFCLNASDIGFSNKVHELNEIRLRKQTLACKGVLDKDFPVYVIVRMVS